MNLKKCMWYLMIIGLLFSLCTTTSASNDTEKTELLTITGKEIYVKFEWFEEELSIPYYCDEFGNEVDSFIEYDIYGNEIIQYRTKDEEQPTYSVILSNFIMPKEYVTDISGTEVTIPHCDLPPMSTLDMRDNPDNYEFKCWRFEVGNEIRFYYPGDTIVIPNRDITLYAIFVEKGTETTIPDTYNIIFKSNDESNSVIESIDIYAGNPVEMPDSLFTREGYTFSHWTDGTANYNPGDTFIMPDHDVTMTAVWKKNTPVEDDKPETDNSKPSFNWFPIINQVQNNKPEPEKENITTTSPEPDTYICPYKDISGHWAEDIIKFIDELGLIDGITATEFQPNEPMTREMFVTAVARLAGVESDYVSWAINNGILLGYGNGEYGLTDTVTREQMAVFFLRFFEKMGIDTAELRVKDAYTFVDDESISDWAAGAVYEIQMIGLIQGKENNLFDPQGTATRAEAATVLYNLIQTIMNNN